MRAHESINGAPAPATNITSTSSPFELRGGKYWFGVNGTFNSATATIQKVLADSTLINASTGITSNGANSNDLPPGKYQVTISGSTTAVLVWEIVRIPGE
jgi:hypothetical protein